MTDKVYVYNKNEYPIREIFKGEEVNIAAHDYWRDKNGDKKEVDLFEANDYRGQYYPVPFDGSGKMIPDPKYFKMITLVPAGEAKAPSGANDKPAFKCMAKDCKHVSPSPEELEAHTSTRHQSIEKLILPDEDARSVAKKGK